MVHFVCVILHYLKFDLATPQGFTYHLVIHHQLIK